MALLCFPKESLAEPLQELMDPALRRRIAANVNEMILKFGGLDKEPKIQGLVRLRAWAENCLRNENKDFPTLELGLSIDQSSVDQPMT